MAGLPGSSEVGDAPALEALVARTKGLQPWRRVVHAVSGILCAGILVFLEPSRGWAVATLGGLAGLVLVLDWVRLRVPQVNFLFFRILRPLASPREKGRVASSTWFVVGCLVAVAAFPLQVAVSSILVLALADPVAGYVGQRWGRTPMGSGTVEGSLTFSGLAFLILLGMSPWPTALVTAVITAAVEALPLPLDDNVTIPGVAGATLWTLLLLQGG